jgi:LmbE family N-acetylglucosaminyl deacetylase
MIENAVTLQKKMPAFSRLMNPYAHLVSEYARLVQEGKTYPLGKFQPAPRPEIPTNAPKALFFAPHPDDECIVGGIALRIMREARMNLMDVAVTQGSKKERQAERLTELEAACRYLGYGLIKTSPSGLERINPKTRQEDPTFWAGCVKVIANILTTNQPKVILFPHEKDWNSTHIGTHFLVMDALKQMPPGFETYIIETEFWGQMAAPNLMVEISAEDLADMITATTFHVGEVTRNPFHLLLPAWMQDNVRRGAELVGGQGGKAPDFAFAALYRLSKWSGGKVNNVFEGGTTVTRGRNIGELFI